MVHTYPRARYVTAILLQDVVMLLAMVMGLWQSGPLATALLVAAPAAMLWGVVTLHFPSSVTIDDRAIAFSRYGRTHRFLWRDITSLKVRRFLVRDRVLVRISPSPAWSGRYWIFETIGGYESLISILESKSAPSS